MNHFIHKQVFDIHVASKQDAKTWQNKISAAIRDLAFTKLEKAFDELSDQEEIIRIDRLELDLGKIDSTNFLQILDEQAAIKFKESITKKYMDYLVVDTEFDAENGVQVSRISDQKRPETKSDLETCVHYFRNGVLPWWFSKEHKFIEDKYTERKYVEHKYIDEIWNNYLLKTDEVDWEGISNDLLHEDQASRMISITYEPNRLLLILKILHIKLDLKLFNQIISKDLKPINPLQLKTILLSYYRSIRDTRDAKDAAFLMLVNRLIAAKPALQKGNEFIRNVMKHFEIDSRYETVIPNIQTLIQHGNGFDKLAALLQSPGNFIDTIEKLVTSGTTPVMARNVDTIAGNPPKSAQKKSPAEDHSIPIPNAGVVILWPYLQMFFKELGYVKGKEFVSVEAQIRAVQMLHFLVSNQKSGEEWEWPLLKLICGLQIHDFVEDQFELTDKERKESENLLNAVIQNWTVLKSTKPSTLQASFLRREGLLKKEHIGWIVQIERTGIDVLLDKISWPLSVIRLPWNDFMIHVKWLQKK